MCAYMPVVCMRTYSSLSVFLLCYPHGVVLGISEHLNARFKDSNAISNLLQSIAASLLSVHCVSHCLSYLTPGYSAFKQAQSNITELNAIVWGTCNTNTPEDTCTANMQWFTDNLKTPHQREARILSCICLLCRFLASCIGLAPHALRRVP